MIILIIYGLTPAVQPYNQKFKHINKDNLQSKKILIVAPHADDEVLGIGGTVSKYKDTHQLGLIICGQRLVDNDNNVKQATSHYDYVDILSQYKDEHYHENFTDVVKCVEDSVKSFRPDCVFIPNSNDFNKDHRTIHRVCEIVFRRYQEHAPDMILMYETPSSTTQSFHNNFKCNYYEVLDESHVQSKIDTFLYYEKEVRQYPNPRSAEGLLTYAKFRGMECNAEYAEGFQILYQKQL